MADETRNPPAPQPQTRDGVANPTLDPNMPQPNTTGDIPMSDSKHMTDNTTITDPNSDADQEDKAEQSAYERAHPGSLGLLTEPEHALPVLRTKVAELHQMTNNVGNVMEVPVHAFEALLADIGYLLRMFRPVGSTAPKAAPIVTQNPN